MALIKCSECEKEISDKAASCPNCGMPMKPAKEEIKPLLETSSSKPGEEKSKTGIYVGIGAAVVAVIAIIIFAVSQAGGGRPDNMSERIYNVGIQALAVVDEYIDGRVGISTARSRMSPLRDSAAIYAREAGEGHWRDSGVNIRISGVYMALWNRASTLAAGEDNPDIPSGGQHEDVVEARNSLASALGESQR